MFVALCAGVLPFRVSLLRLLPLDESLKLLCVLLYWCAKAVACVVETFVASVVETFVASVVETFFASVVETFVAKVVVELLHRLKQTP